MPEHVIDTLVLAKDSTTSIPVGDVVRVLGYYDPGDGGAALWVRRSSEPQHLAKYQNDLGQWFELAAGQIVSIAMLGAKGDADAAGGGSTSTNDQGPIDAALSFADEVYCPRGITGYYKVDPDLDNYATPGKRLWGPGVIVPVGTLNIPYYGDTFAAGVKYGSPNPTHARGGFLVGGSTATPEGIFFKAQRESIADIIPSRVGDPIEFQVYANLVHGAAELDPFGGGVTADTLEVVSTNSPFTIQGGPKVVHPNDLIWVGEEKFRVDTISNPTFGPIIVTLKTYPDGNPLTPQTSPSRGPQTMYWTGYRSHEYIGTYDSVSGKFN